MDKEETNEKCWICGEEANSREHAVKKTDLDSTFPDHKPGMPLFQYSVHGMKRLQSTNARVLTYKNRICGSCNNTKTQPFDKAWDRLKKGFDDRLPSEHIRANRIFKNFTRKNLQNVHLYFVKHFGCYLQDFLDRSDVKDEHRNLFNGLSKSLADSIKHQKPHPDIYLKFYYDFDQINNTAGRSDWVFGGINEEPPLCAAWEYWVGKLSVQITFDRSVSGYEKKTGHWHPRSGTSLLRIFSRAAD